MYLEYENKDILYAISTFNWYLLYLIEPKWITL